MDQLNREFEILIYRSLIASQWESLTAKNDNKEQTASERYATLGKIIQENLLTRDNAFTTSGSKSTPAEAAFESVFAALPPVMTHFKEIVPSYELIRCVLDGLSKIRFTENNNLMGLVSF